ncbi:MAG: single-stranded DNA-binding protein, partial [Acetanaerobacterium sp.]
GQGVKRRAFEIVADNINFCESKTASSSNTHSGGIEPPPMPVSFENAGGEDFSVVTGDDDLPF